VLPCRRSIRLASASAVVSNQRASTNLHDPQVLWQDGSSTWFTVGRCSCAILHRPDNGCRILRHWCCTNGRTHRVLRADTPIRAGAFLLREVEEQLRLCRLNGLTGGQGGRSLAWREWSIAAGLTVSSVLARGAVCPLCLLLEWFVASDMWLLVHRQRWLGNQNTYKPSAGPWSQEGTDSEICRQSVSSTPVDNQLRAKPKQSRSPHTPDRTRGSAIRGAQPNRFQPGQMNRGQDANSGW